jgi:hypothetical protein
MLAELIENATSFSPPHTPVHVAGHEVSNGCAIEVEDRGLGMSPEEFRQINERLENPPPFDLSTSERLGLFVVGRLAERHGIRVRLRDSPYGGTMAIVLLPGSLMRPTEDEADELAMADVAGRELTPVGVGASTDDTEFPGGGGFLAGDPLTPGPGIRSMFDPPPGRNDDEPLLDDLPVFATVRSSWFVADRPRQRTKPDNGSPDGGGGEHADGSADVPGADGAGGMDQAMGADLAGSLDETGGPAASLESPLPSAGEAGLVPVQPPAPASHSEYPAPSAGYQMRSSGGYRTAPLDPLDPASPVRGLGSGQPAGHARPSRPEVHSTTPVGLPKRTRRANLAPELRSEAIRDTPSPAVVAGPRSPEQIRAMMSSFQANFGRGLAAGQPVTDGNDTTTRGR